MFWFQIELCFPEEGLVYDYKLNDGGITNFEDDDDSNIKQVKPFSNISFWNAFLPKSVQSSYFLNFV